MADLERQLVFPDIIQTNIRPDIMLWFYECKMIALVELAAI